MKIFFSKAHFPMANYTLANFNFYQTILKLLFQVLVGACARNYYALVIRQRPNAWLLPSSMKALSFHTGKSAKKRKSHVKVTLTKGLLQAQEQAQGFPAPRRAVRRKAHWGVY